MFIAKISYETLWAGSKVSACLPDPEYSGSGRPKADYRNYISIASGYCLTPFEPAPCLPAGLPFIQLSINMRFLTESNLYK